ncbi:hypothetical protein vB_RpoS-V16_21 [Ruegeria phage vB_RpoS-V16]|uniref:hypothetical protein n=1 Tax=Ruegeria phage vB_RpoS-V16 TaxID=2218618 RepID=UPI000DCAD9BC|nr:hypothetical protein JT311_gp21 [Ruegeria phage vB_RpoS-V16]AWY09457.1 hypothetical protein vB_RpoS-V16_21 [Ruegeria phage vB_RpoS-V16]
MIPPAKPPRPPRVTDLRIELVHYHAAEGACTGSNLLYKVDGRPSSSRVPWVAQNPAAEAARLEKLLERTASLRARRQPKANLSTLEEFEK